MDDISKRTVRYFISYTRADGKLPDKLLAELKKELGASSKYLFVPWRDTDILPGERWHAEIQRAVHDCDFGLLLVSPAFLGNGYVTGHELPVFVGGTKPCIPVMLCPVDLQNQNLRGLERLQLFGYAPPRDPRARSFQECTSPKHQTAFAHELFKDICSRLDGHFGSLACTETEPPNMAESVASTLQRTFACQFREFRGRGGDLRRLEQALLKDHKCAGVVIGAFGGMGKTALAHQFCTVNRVGSLFDLVLGASAKKRYLDVGAFGLHEGGERQADQAVETIHEYLLQIATQLRLKDPGALSDRKLEEEIRVALGGKRALLLLDNLETIDQTHTALQLLGRVCSPPAHKFLITARKLPESLGLGVTAVALDRLESLDSRLLVRDLLEDLDPKLASRLGEDSEAIAAILKRAEGHPLALRLLTGKLVAQGEKAILTLPESDGQNGTAGWSAGFFQFVFDEAFLSYLEPIATDVGSVIASYPNGLTERSLLSACKTVHPELASQSIQAAIERLLRTFCLHREHLDGEVMLAMHPLTREFFITLQ
jgi:TIR domain